MTVGITGRIGVKIAATTGKTVAKIARTTDRGDATIAKIGVKVLSGKSEIDRISCDGFIAAMMQ